MVSYTIRISQGKKAIPVMETSDPKYQLAGELFLAERSFLKELISFAEDDSESEFNGNAFSVRKEADSVLIENTVTEEEIKLVQSDFLDLLNAYYFEYKRIR